MRLSIIIVSWNTRDLLAGCLQSIDDGLGALAPAALETFVVDNASQDGSVAMVQERFPQVHLTQNEANSGFAQANNQAIQRCTGEYILLLNPDTRLHTGALEALVDFMDRQPHAGAAGSRLLNADGSLQTSCHPAPALGRELWRLLHLDKLYAYALYPMHSWPLDRPREVDVVQGASMIVRRAALDQVGLLDEDYFMYTEEVDWCYRMRQTGWTIHWVPASIVTHYGGQSTRQVAEPMFLMLYQTKLLYFRKHHGVLAALLYKLILCVAAVARLLFGPVAGLIRPDRRTQQASLTRNYRRLLLELPGL
jgi:GT2 family glycosyltransferase